VAEVPATASLADVVAERADRKPAAVMLRRRTGGGQWQDVTAGMFRDEVSALARGVIAAGIEPGDRIGLMARTRYEWTLIDYAIWTAGAVTVPVYETSSAEQVEWILGDSGARAVFAETSSHARAIDGVRGRLADLDRGIWQIDELDALVAGGAPVSDDQLARRRGQPRAADLATIIYTSGTTGRPKGCELTHGNLLAVVRNAVTGPLYELFEKPGSSTLLFLPLAHSFARVIQIGCLEAGVVLGHWPDTSTLIEGLPEFRPTFLLAVPRVFEKVYASAQQQAGASKAKSMIFSAAAETAIAWSKAAERRGANGSGANRDDSNRGDVSLSDSSGSDSSSDSSGSDANRDDFSLSNSSGSDSSSDSSGSDSDRNGRAGPGARLRLRHALFDRLVYARLRAAVGGKVQYAVSGGAPLGDRLGHFFRGAGLPVLEGYGLTETSAAASVNRPDRNKVGTVGMPLPGVSMRIADDGEILIRGLNVFSGYWRNPAATADVLDADGWLHSGDLGDLDDEGFLRVTGRKKELIVTAGGKNVAPAVLEDRIRAHLLVSQCMVVGDGRPYVACLVTLDADALGYWKERHGHPATAGPADLADDPELIGEIQAAVDAANRAVSRAESVRRFRILDTDFTEQTGHLTPSMKVRRNVVADDFSADIEALYS
jgi:long-chain acyl-CoA synthetase